jgi:hypothetical protein
MRVDLLVQPPAEDPQNGQIWCVAQRSASVCLDLVAGKALKGTNSNTPHCPRISLSGGYVQP